jgi:hypothetical protein
MMAWKARAMVHDTVHPFSKRCNVFQNDKVTIVFWNPKDSIQTLSIPTE